MRTDVLAAMVAFCFVSGVTPGPNNLMLMTSGVNFGFRRTLPHLFGVVLGFCLMVALVGFGLAAIFARFPPLLPAMRYLGAAYMLWLAWKIAHAGPVHEGKARGAPLGFFGAAAFQWINPKAWVMAVSALTAYAVVDDYRLNVVLVALAYLAVGLPGSGAWALLGSAMRRALSDPNVAKIFNLTMALLLLASIVPVLMEG
jgi:threonine/homoserine/homoserine lactone efflux protein